MDQKTLKDVLKYEPDTGHFYWLKDSQRVRAGQKAGTLSLGYIRIYVASGRHLAHRLAWLYMLGEWPPDQIDHINGNRSDNRWRNLRPASNSQNNVNRRKPSIIPSSGYRGVAYDKRRGHWYAQIKVNRKHIYLGRFEDPKKASLAYQEAARHYFGEFFPSAPHEFGHRAS